MDSVHVTDNTQVARLSRIDKWFLSKLRHIALAKRDTCLCSLDDLDRDALRALKCMGFSDRQIARYTKTDEMQVRRRRSQLKILPFTKLIDTLAAEFPVPTNYRYLTYNAQVHDISRVEIPMYTVDGGVMVSAHVPVTALDNLRGTYLIRCSDVGRIALDLAWSSTGAPLVQSAR